MALSSEPGIYERRMPHREQRYVLAIPPGLEAGRPAPLVLVLHWGGAVTPFYGRSLLEGLVAPALKALGAIMVAPDCLHGDWSNPNSEAEILMLLAYLQGHYPVDRARQVITGYSMGGEGCWYLAARNQDLFSAAVPMAGWPQPDSAEVDWRIPLYVIQSRDDEVIAFEPTEKVVRALQARGKSIEYLLLEGVGHYDSGRFYRPLQAAVPWLKSRRTV